MPQLPHSSIRADYASALREPPSPVTAVMMIVLFGGDHPHHGPPATPRSLFRSWGVAHEFVVAEDSGCVISRNRDPVRTRMALAPAGHRVNGHDLLGNSSMTAHGYGLSRGVVQSPLEPGCDVVVLPLRWRSA